MIPGNAGIGFTSHPQRATPFTRTPHLEGGNERQNADHLCSKNLCRENVHSHFHFLVAPHLLVAKSIEGTKDSGISSVIQVNFTFLVCKLCQAAWFSVCYRVLLRPAPIKVSSRSCAFPSFLNFKSPLMNIQLKRHENFKDALSISSKTLTQKT